MNFFGKKINHIVDLFPKLRSPKSVLWSMSKKYRFRQPFEKQYCKRAQTLLKSERQHFYYIYWSLRGILRLFVNILTTHDKYSPLNRENSTQPIQMQLSQKQKTLSHFFSRFLKSGLNFEFFRKKDQPHSWSISEITVSKKRTLIDV